jgi:hypothetical protein
MPANSAAMEKNMCRGNSGVHVLQSLLAANALNVGYPHDMLVQIFKVVELPGDSLAIPWRRRTKLAAFVRTTSYLTPPSRALVAESSMKM